jgi:hypothetical protein
LLISVKGSQALSLPNTSVGVVYYSIFFAPHIKRAEGERRGDTDDGSYLLSDPEASFHTFFIPELYYRSRYLARSITGVIESLFPFRALSGLQIICERYIMKLPGIPNPPNPFPPDST